MRLHIIGTGGPRPRPGAEGGYGTACALEFGQEMILLDCGPGTTYKMAKMGLSPTQVNTLFITHHHSDHNIDFPCFALLRFDLDNGDLPPLTVYGPEPTKAFVEQLSSEYGVFAPDIVSRREHPVAVHNYTKRGGKKLRRPKAQPEAHNVASGTVVETDSWKFTAVQVPHLEPYLTSLAYRIDTDEGSVLYLGDAGICDELIEMAKGVDTLVTGILSVNTREVDDLHHNVSADVPDVIDLATQAGIQRVVGIHGSPPADGLRDLLRKGYDGFSYTGELIVPSELETVQL